MTPAALIDSQHDLQIRRFIGSYPAAVRTQVQQLLSRAELGAYLSRKYPARHVMQTDTALHAYVMGLKNAHLRSSAPLHKVIWQNKMDVLQNVLGLHTSISRVQGSKLKAKAEIRIASLFKSTAPEFLEMVVVHELAHLREREHNRAFYQLCEHLLPDYHQIEFDLRLLLLHNAVSAAA